MIVIGTGGVIIRFLIIINTYLSLIATAQAKTSKSIDIRIHLIAETNNHIYQTPLRKICMASVCNDLDIDHFSYFYQVWVTITLGTFLKLQAHESDIIQHLDSEWGWLSRKRPLSGAEQRLSAHDPLRRKPADEAGRNTPARLTRKDTGVTGARAASYQRA
jgi:hypothetical protein